MPHASKGVMLEFASNLHCAKEIGMFNWGEARTELGPAVGEKGCRSSAATYIIQTSTERSKSFVRRSSIEPFYSLLCIILSKGGRLGGKTLLAKGLTLCGWRAVT